MLENCIYMPDNGQQERQRYVALLIKRNKEFLRSPAIHLVILQCHDRTNELH